MKRHTGYKRKDERVIANLENVIRQSRDFSIVEDSPESISIIRQLASRAAINAAAEARAAGLSHTFVRGCTIIRLHADGREEIISMADDEQIKGGSFYIYSSPSIVLHVRGK